MRVPTGTRLGPYEVVAPMGAGGMGEVYRARDTRLERDVALKVLPEAVALDAERMARFEREAKVLASLNHPNIAHIHAVEESNGVRALVMELVEGRTLAERIREAPLPLEDALSIAKQIAEGLEYAHECGIIHRDLKPANVKVSPTGEIKLLDFGLAKALGPDRAATNLSSSPTLSHHATQAGIILGTAPYMSPEQAKGKAVDRRADIWAFGCVLYEMLTGKAAFGGETVTDVLAAVVRAEPEWALLPEGTPPDVRSLLRRCLRKDPRERLRDVGDARIAIEEARSGGQDLEAPSAPAVLPRPWWTAWGLPLALALGLAFALAGHLSRLPESAQTIISEIPPPDSGVFVIDGNSAGPPVLSPDGKQLAFVAEANGRAVLWVRQLAAPRAQPLEGTEGASFPFWSPDSHSIGFFASGKLKRVVATGGPAAVIADAHLGRGGAWGPDGTILYTPSIADSLYRIPASGGGVPQKVTEFDHARLDTSHRWPQFLPDGKHFLFFAHANRGSATYLASLQGGVPERLIPGDTSALYAAPNHLLFIRQGTLMAQRFDATSLHLVGDAVPLAQHTSDDAIVWRPILSASDNGMLVYLDAHRFARSLRLLWFDRSGKELGQTGTADNYGTVSLSPGGDKLAVVIRVANIDTWVYDLTRGVRARVTFSADGAGQPCWSPDGRALAFVVNPGQGHIYQQTADGTGNVSPLVVDGASESRPSFSFDGRYLLFERQARETGSRAEIWSLPLVGDRKPFAVLTNQEFDLHQPALSPDGKWLAYIAAESGQDEVYLAPFGSARGKWLVSTTGGRFPRWRRDGKEIFYLSGDNKMMSAEILETGASVNVGKVTPLFQVRPASTFGCPYDVSADGSKFIIDTLDIASSPQLTLIANWPALLNER